MTPFAVSSRGSATAMSAFARIIGDVKGGKENLDVASSNSHFTSCWSSAT